MLDSTLKLLPTQQRKNVRICLGVSKTSENGEVVRFLPLNFDLVTALNDLDLRGLRYYCILHNKDSSYIHYHLVLLSNINRKVKTWLNTIADTFHCDVNNVQLIDCDDVVESVQYLIHKNHIDKEPYDYNEILTNDDRRHLEEILEEKVTHSECLTMKEICSIVRKAKDLEEVYCSFSSSFLRSNLGIINSLCRAYGKM